MSDKKNEDYVVRMPEGSYEQKDKGSFNARSPASSSYGGNSPALPKSFSKLDNSPLLSVFAYCISSISMTVVNKYVVSGQGWNLNFLYLAVQV
jgi:GDP-mannose transporter